MKSTTSSRAERAALVSSQLSTYPHSKHNGKYKNWLRWLMSDSWALEYMAITIAMTALAAIFIILILYNHKPLDDWPHSIQINTVLSTLATVVKGFLLLPVCACLSQLKWLWYTHNTKSLQDFQIFDMASRGPWGSLQLLCRLKFWHMASIGCLLTLMSLASDAFVQQSVSFPLRVHLPRNSSATLPYSQHFDSYSTSAGFPHASQSLMTAIYDGVYSENFMHSTSSITANCPTGNCSFPPYASLAVCSKCHNVSSFLQYTTESNLLGATHSYALPNGHSLISTQTSVAHFNITSSTGPSTLPQNHLEPNSDDLAVYLSAVTIANISMIVGGNPADPRNQTAWDCVLLFCAKSFYASVSHGVFQETPLDVFDEVGSNIETVIGEFDNNVTFEVPTSQLEFVRKRDRTFSINSTAMSALQDSLGATLLGETETNVVGRFAFTSGIAQGFYYNGGANVVRTLANIADALTNAVRVSSEQQVQGVVRIEETHIHVQWLWLIYPLVMVVLGAIFLALTVWRTRKSEVPSWRSSVLAVMEHGVNTSLHEEIGSSQLSGLAADPAAAAGKEKVSDLEVWAEDISVRLRRRGLWDREYGLSVT
jgi:Protein of unknown function (DUF3176)